VGSYLTFVKGFDTFENPKELKMNTFFFAEWWADSPICFQRIWVTIHSKNETNWEIQSPLLSEHAENFEDATMNTETYKKYIKNLRHFTYAKWSR
jgi:hypothetical protein